MAWWKGRAVFRKGCCQRHGFPTNSRRALNSHAGGCHANGGPGVLCKSQFRPTINE